MSLDSNLLWTKHFLDTIFLGKNYFAIKRIKRFDTFISLFIGYKLYRIWSLPLYSWLRILVNFKWISMKLCFQSNWAPAGLLSQFFFVLFLHHLFRPLEAENYFVVKGLPSKPFITICQELQIIESEKQTEMDSATKNQGTWFNRYDTMLDSWF